MYSVYTLSLIRINPITTQWKPQPNPQSKRRESQITETYKNKKSAPKLDTLFHFPTLINMN